MSILRLLVGQNDQSLNFSANMPWFFHPTERFRHFPSVSDAIKYKKVLNFPILKFFSAKFYVPFLSCLCLVLVASETSLQHSHHGIIFRGKAENIPRKSLCIRLCMADVVLRLFQRRRKPGAKIRQY
jgi:hypothetical protein